MWDAVSNLYFRGAWIGQLVFMSFLTQQVRNFDPPQGHHTIPVYLCGGMNQVKSKIPASSHAIIHGEIAGIKLSLDTAEDYANKALGRYRSEQILKIAQTKTGRENVANALRMVYDPWWLQGTPPIGSTFMGERGAYVSGANTSLPWCSRDGRP